MIHDKPFEGAGRTFTLDAKGIDGIQIHVEDYWDRVAGRSWTVCDANPAAMSYGIRSGLTGLPLDDEVVYGKVDLGADLVETCQVCGTLWPCLIADLADLPGARPAPIDWAALGPFDEEAPF